MESSDMFKKWFSSIILTLVLSTGLAFSADKIDVNTASAEQLQSIKGVGASTAAAIIEFRESYGSFTDINELVNVKGIGEKKLEKISDFISVSVPE